MRELLNSLARESISTIILIIVLFITVVFIVREVICWYWKINRQVYLLESIDQHLTKIECILDKEKYTEAFTEHMGNNLDNDCSVVSKPLGN
jgi:hypothetical protein